MMVVLTLAMEAGQQEAGVAVALGILLTNLCDLTEPPRLRWRTMLTSAAALALVTLLGGLVSVHWATHLITAFGVAALAGYAGALGFKGSWVGVLCLALFSFYTGNEISSLDAWKGAVGVLAGGLVATLTAMVDAPFQRFGATRCKFAIAYLKFAEVCDRPPANGVGLGVASAILDATRSVDVSGAAGATEQWLRQLLACLERSRIVIIALAARRPLMSDAAALDRVLASAAELAGGIATALAHPRRASRLPALLGSLQAACDAPFEPVDAALTASLHAALDEAAGLLAGRWPIGAAASLAPVKATGPGWRERLRQHFSTGDLFFRHGRQMALTYGLATAISLGPWDEFFLGHAFWIPLTVAWICKPDLAGTVSKLSMRVVGTFIGVLLGVVVLGAWPMADTGILLIGLGAFVACVFVGANYSVVVAAITVLVLGFGELAGLPVGPLAETRLLATVIGAAIVLVAALIQPLRSGRAVPGQLARLCTDLRRYAGVLHSGGPEAERAPVRQALLQDRTALSASVAAAAWEPRGCWKSDRPGLDITLTRTLLDRLEATLSSLVVLDLLGDRHGPHAPSQEQVDEVITWVEQRIAEGFHFQPASAHATA